MTTSNLSHIEGIVWDLDGTLYRYSELFLEACNIAAARTVLAMGLDMSFEDALVLARESEIQSGSSFKLFTQFGLKYEDFHAPYHAAVDTTIIEKNLEMKQALTALEMPMVILTNASRDWALKTINHIELDELFPDANILALEDVGFQGKATSKTGFLKALDILSVKPEQTLMVEDMAHNLLHAKDLGMTTSLVHHDRVSRDTSHVDHIFDDALVLAKTLLAR